MKGFPIDLDRLKGLAATRGGRVALGGFEYQRAFATLRMVSMLIANTVKGCSSQIPLWIRYEWAEDIDELDTNGDITLWQCKHGDDWTEPAKLASVFAGFAPKWLWTPEAQRSHLNLRIVTSDPAYAEFRDLPGPLKKRDAVRNSFLSIVNKKKVGKDTDLAQWQADARALGVDRLFDELWAATQLLFVPGATSSSVGLWPAEEDALNALTRAHWLAQDFVPQDIIQALHALLGLAPSAPVAGSEIDRLTVTPLGVRQVDVSDRLDPFRRQRDGSSLILPLIDRTELSRLRQLVPRHYVARRPEWQDVVHGIDATIGFFERSITGEVMDSLRSALEECLHSQERLRLQLLVGAPGSGKSTLALRLAAQLVDEGVCSVIDARFAVSDEDEITAVVATLQRRLDPHRALLLLLDDPLGVASLWPRVLDKLSKQRPRMVVLAATPDFLLHRYQQQLSSLKLLPLQRVSRPDKTEQRALASLYPHSNITSLSSGDEELLVLTMLASTNTSFDDIIDGLWDNLAEGVRLSNTIVGRDLPWEVTALWVVVFFQRAYGACPLLLLKAFLASKFRDDEEVGERLAQMRSDHGWGIFQIEESPASLAFQGGTVRTMHSLVAQAAWARRPAPSWSVIELIAKASLRCAMAARPLAQSLASLHDSQVTEARPLVEAVAQAWCAADVSTLETRYLCELCWVWKRSSVPLPPCFDKALRFRMELNDKESWLAAYHLLYIHSTTQVLSLSNPLPYQQVLDSADFFTAQSRAMAFYVALGDQPVLQARLLDRLWRAFDVTQGARISSAMLDWLLINGGFGSVLARKDAIRAWIARNPSDTHVRVALMTHLKRFVQADRIAMLNDLRDWLACHPEDVNVRNAFLGYINEFSEYEQAAILDDYLSWLAMHSDDNNVRNSFLKRIDKLGVQEQLLVLERYRQWLGDHPEDTNVRSAFLRHFGKFSAGEQAIILEDYRNWLVAHPLDGNVRMALLLCLREHDHAMLLDVLEQTIKDLGTSTSDFQPASVALSILETLEAEHLPLMVRWMQWTARVCELYMKSRRPKFVLRSSISGIIERVRSHAQSTYCLASDRDVALQTADHLENALLQWRASLS